MKSEDLSQFKKLIRSLHRFERIRYPDSLVKKGMLGLTAWSAPATLPASNQPRYAVIVHELDKLVATIVRVCNYSRTGLLSHLNRHQSGFDVLYDDNPEKAFWQGKSL